MGAAQALRKSFHVATPGANRQARAHRTADVEMFCGGGEVPLQEDHHTGENSQCPTLHIKLLRLDYVCPPIAHEEGYNKRQRKREIYCRRAIDDKAHDSVLWRRL